MKTNINHGKKLLHETLGISDERNAELAEILQEKSMIFLNEHSLSKTIERIVSQCETLEEAIYAIFRFGGYVQYSKKPERPGLIQVLEMVSQHHEEKDDPLWTEINRP